MFGKVKIGDNEIEMLANAATTLRYKQVFNEDLLVLFSGGHRAGKRDEDENERLARLNAETLDISQKLAFIMKLQAEKNDFRKVNIDSYIEWLEGLQIVDLVRASGEIMSLFYGNEKTASTPKKKADQRKER